MFDNFRLQKDGGWRKYEGDKFVQKNDFTTEDPSVLLGLQKYDSVAELDGKLYKVEPKSWSPADFDVVYYKNYVYRDLFPVPPSRSQFDSTLAAGDDSKKNRLVLRVNGQFDLISGRDVFLGKNELLLVGFYEASAPGNGYVGPDTIAPEYTKTNDIVFNQFLRCWIDHLKDGYLAQFIGEDYEIIHDSQKLWNEIGELEQNWDNVRKRWTV